MATTAQAPSLPAQGRQAWYTHCPVYHAGNVDAELGWRLKEYKKLGALTIQNDFDVTQWAAPQFLEQALADLAN